MASTRPATKPQAPARGKEGKEPETKGTAAVAEPENLDAADGGDLDLSDLEDEGTDEEPATLDAEGRPLTKKGALDKRYKYAPGTRPVSRPAGETREEKLKRLFGYPDEVEARGWEYVEHGTDPNTRASATGARLKDWYTIKDSEGELLTVGRGEMIKFAGVQPPAAQRRRASNEDFERAFDADETPSDVDEGDSEAPGGSPPADDSFNLDDLDS